jgi:hypothetical protein
MTKDSVDFIQNTEMNQDDFVKSAKQKITRSYRAEQGLKNNLISSCFNLI